MLRRAVATSAGVTVRRDSYGLAYVDPDLWEVVRAPGNLGAVPGYGDTLEDSNPVIEGE